MSLLSRLFAPPAPPLAELWGAIVAAARAPEWYTRHQVADTIDGRFDMVALVASLVLLRFEREGAMADHAVLTERFVEDMDGSLRDIGIGDMVIGKHMGRVIGALGGRLGAYRGALAGDAPPDALAAALARNVYRGAPPDGEPAGLAEAVRALAARVDAAPSDALRAGRF